MRIIPVLVRLDKAKLINIYGLRQQIHRGIVANFAAEITEIVLIRVINQLPESIRQGELIGWLFHLGRRQYIDINNINEVEAIASILINLIVYQVRSPNSTGSSSYLAPQYCQPPQSIPTLSRRTKPTKNRKCTPRTQASS